MSARKDGKTAITILLNKQDVEALHLIMEADSRETMADCIRAIVRSTAKKILPNEFGIQNATPAHTKRAAANNQ